MRPAASGGFDGGANGVSTDYFWAPVPEKLLYDHRISDKAVRVYACLQRHGMTKDDCYPSHRRIAELIGCAQRSVQRPLAELERYGWITRHPRFDRRGDRVSDGFTVRTDCAPPTHHSADQCAREGALHHALERDEREPGNESPLNDQPLAPGAVRLQQRMAEVKSKSEARTS